MQSYHDESEKAFTPNADTKSGTTAPPSEKAHIVKEHLEETVNIMQSNIEKMMERGETLETLQTKTGTLLFATFLASYHLSLESLQQDSLQFRRGATTTRNKIWWKSFRLNFLIGLFVLSIVLLIICKPGSFLYLSPSSHHCFSFGSKI